MHMTDPQPRWSCTRIMGLIRQPYRHNPSNDLYLDQQSIDTTTPASKLRFQLTGALAEFERSMIRQTGWSERHQGEVGTRWDVRLQGWQGAEAAWRSGAEAARPGTSGTDERNRDR
jgi:hypothetical protein